MSKWSETHALRAHGMTAFPFEPAPDELSVFSFPCIYKYDSRRKHDLIDRKRYFDINHGLIDQSINRPNRYGTSCTLGKSTFACVFLFFFFFFVQAYFVLDEFLLGGELLESSKKSVLRAVATQDQLQEVRRAGF